MHVNYIDLIIALLLAAFGVYGLIRGFMKQVIGMLSTVCALAIAYLFASRLADLLLSKTAVANLTETIKNFLGEDWNIEIPIAKLGEFLSNKNLPSFIVSIIEKAANSVSAESINIADVAAEVISRYAVIGLSFIGLFLIGKLLFFLLERFLAFIIKRTPIKIVDRILGVSVSIIKVSIGIWIAVFLIMILPIESFNSLKSAISESYLGTLYYKYNPISYLLSLII